MIRVSVIGLGAMGASYAAKIFDSGCVDVRVIADGDRAQRLRRDGVTVKGKRYDFTVLTPDDDVEPADLMIVAVKHTALKQALPQMTRHMSGNTVVLSLLNGITSEDEIAAAYPQCHPLLSITFAIDAVRKEQTINYLSFGRIEFGEKSNTEPYTEQVRWLARLFDAAGISYTVPYDMVRELWWKFMINVGVNQVTAVIGAPYCVIQDPKGPAFELMIAAQREVIAVARAQGIDLTEADLGTWCEVLAGLGPQQYTSMAQDVLARRPTEVDIFGGTMRRLGSQFDIAVPVNTCLYQLLKAKEQTWMI